MPEQRCARRYIEIEIPGREPLRIHHVALDFNDTVAADGKLVGGVGARIARLATRVKVVVMTADTFGTARRACARLPVAVHVVRSGAEERRLVESLGRTGVAVVGNGANDVPMFKAARLGVAVCGAEGVSASLLRAATLRR